MKASPAMAETFNAAVTDGTTTHGWVTVDGERHRAVILWQDGAAVGHRLIYPAPTVDQFVSELAAAFRKIPA